MNSKAQLILIVLLFAFIIIGGVLVYNRYKDNYEEESSVTSQSVTESKDILSSAETTNKKNTAPDFSVLDKDGNTVSLSDYFGKPIILNFWASWCGPCQSEMPHFEKLYKEYEKEVVFLMVNLTDGRNETVKSVNDFIKEKGYTFPVYYDTRFKASSAYQVSGIPRTFGIDKNGNIVADYIGSLTEAKLQRIIDSVK